MHLTCPSYVLHASSKILIFIISKTFWGVQITNHVIVQTPPISRFLVPFEAINKNILLTYSAFFCIFNNFTIFQNKLFWRMIYVSCLRLSLNIYIRNNMLSLLPISLVVLFMIIFYTTSLNKCKTELAFCIHLFPQPLRQVIISSFPDHLHKTAVSSDVLVT